MSKKGKLHYLHSPLAALGQSGDVLTVTQQQSIDSGVAMLGLESGRVDEIAERQSQDFGSLL